MVEMVISAGAGLGGGGVPLTFRRAAALFCFSFPFAFPSTLRKGDVFHMWELLYINVSLQE